MPMGTTPPNDTVHVVATVITTIAGLVTVVALAFHGDIHDGETISAVAAVLGIQIGTYAFKKNQQPQQTTNQIVEPAPVNPPVPPSQSNATQG